ncbi:MAG: T9SS type A sorting domain-containing protein [Spirosomataceae bacterium]
MKHRHLLLMWLCLLTSLVAQSQTLPTPVLVFPANNATGVTSTVTLSWQAVSGADQYKVSVSTPNHSNDIAWDSMYVGTTYQLKNLPNGTYLWRIKAKHAANPYQASAWTATWQFTVGVVVPPPPPVVGLTAPVLATPTNGSMLQVLGTNLTWQAVSGATYYKVKVATDAAMNNVVFTDNNVTVLNRVAQNLMYNTTYYWTVQAANATSTSPVSSVRTFTTMPDNPNAVTSHPRLLITQADLPRLRSWATPSNPVFTAMQAALNSAISTYNSKFFPGGIPNPNWPDLGNTTWSGYVTESYAEFFAFWSLIDPVVANRPVHAQRARNLLMYVIDEALKGTASGVPFRDPFFMTYDRSRVYGEASPLTVDWIYNAKDANNNDILTAADKAKIRTVFMRWCNDQLSAYNHPTPIGLLNDKTITLTNRNILNNYFSGHARNLTFMSLSIDAVDDAPIDPTIHYSALGNSLRSYIYNATGAWLYQQYAQYEKPEIVAADYGVPTAGLGMGSGGMSAEGSLYGESIGWVVQELLALKTAGWANEAIIGKQAKLLNSACWTRLMDGLLHEITPSAKVFSQASYMGPVYQVANYGDLLRTWVIPEMLDLVGSIGLLDINLGNNPSRLDKTRWFARNALQGGNANLLSRVGNIWPSSYATQALVYYMLLDPAGSNPPDPRPSLSTSFVDPNFNKLFARTDWTPNATWFNWQCHWTTINHQSGDGNQFELFRKGEWLIKERSGYTNDGIGYTSEFHNTLGLQNDVPPNMQWYEGPTSQRGGQWTNGLNSGDPKVTTSIGTNFAYATGDATNLYNRTNTATDIVFAVRSIVWLNPDFVVVYDRAKSKTANRFKRFFLQFTAPPVVNGKNVTVNTPGGQKVYLSNLLPAASVLTAFPSEMLNSLAELEQTTHELKIEDPANPTDIRFLNVIQGADGNASAGATSLIQSTAGTAFEGALVKNTVVMFPNVWGGGFASTTYTIPSNASGQLVTGLTPNAGYDVAMVPNGATTQVTITPGSQYTADAGGVLVIGTVSGRQAVEESVSEVLMLGASPNPANEATTIQYHLPQEASVSLAVYDAYGRKISLLADNETQAEGAHQYTLPTRSLAPGVYVCKLAAGTLQASKRIVVE